MRRDPTDHVDCHGFGAGWHSVVQTHSMMSICVCFLICLTVSDFFTCIFPIPIACSCCRLEVLRTIDSIFFIIYSLEAIEPPTSYSVPIGSSTLRYLLILGISLPKREEDIFNVEVERRFLSGPVLSGVPKQLTATVSSHSRYVLGPSRHRVSHCREELYVHATFIPDPAYAHIGSSVCAVRGPDPRFENHGPGSGGAIGILGLQRGSRGGA